MIDFTQANTMALDYVCHLDQRYIKIIKTK